MEKLEKNINSTSRTARLAGFFYFLLAITATYALMYAPSQTFVKGDAAATADNILANELIFRLGIASDLISQVIFVFLVLTLYRLLKQVNENRAKLMVALVLVSVPITFLSETFQLTALMILKGELLKSFQPEQKQEVVMMLIKLFDNGSLVVQMFWGHWLVPFGQLVYKSGFLPRILGILLIIGGIAYVIQCLTIIVFPDFRWLVTQFTLIATAIAELSTVFWLLIMGVKTSKTT